MKINTIEKPVGSLEILVHLHRYERATVTNLIKDAGLNQRTAYSALSKLKNQELICQEVSNGFPVCKYYRLTSRGKAVALHLDTIDKLLIAE
jgi:DNA-binding HxlR family transcriptional regulator